MRAIVNKGLIRMKINEVILQSIAKLVVFIILTLAIYLFFSGQHMPGGGFVGGLVLASSFVLLLLAFDIETIEKSFPIDFKLIAALVAFIVVFSGLLDIGRASCRERGEISVVAE